MFSNRPFTSVSSTFLLAPGLECVLASPGRACHLDTEQIRDSRRLRSYQRLTRSSHLTQALFEAMTSVASTATELMAGRERSVTVLMMRFADYMASMLTSDEDFWAEVDQQGLGPDALKQVSARCCGRDPCTPQNNLSQ